MTGAILGDVGVSLFVAGTIFADVAIALFVESAAFGDVGVLLFMPGAGFGDVAVSLFVAGAIFGDFGMSLFVAGTEHRILIRINILVSKNIDIDFVKKILIISIFKVLIFFLFSKNIDSNNVFFAKNTDLNIDLIGWLFGHNFNKEFQCFWQPLPQGKALATRERPIIPTSMQDPNHFLAESLGTREGGDLEQKQGNP